MTLPVFPEHVDDLVAEALGAFRRDLDYATSTVRLYSATTAPVRVPARWGAPPLFLAPEQGPPPGCAADHAAQALADAAG